MSELLQHFEGAGPVLQQAEVLREFGRDHRLDRGAVRKTIDKLHPHRIHYVVTEIIEVTTTTKTFRLASTDAYLPPFMAGQYINVFVEIEGIRTSRPYSLSSSPHQTAYYEITVRRNPDGFVSDYMLDRVKVGDRLESTSPSGTFYYNPLIHGSDLVFIAGGCGITPFLSMVLDVVEKGDDSKTINLIYGCADPEDVAFRAEFDRIQALHPNFQWHLVVSEPPTGYQGYTGFITTDILKAVLGDDLSHKKFFLCGPEVMYAFCKRELQKAGAEPGDIRSEVQSSPAQPTDQPGWPEDVTTDTSFQVTVGDQSFQAKATESLMDSLERNGLVLPAQCRSGECSLCRTRLLVGKVYQSPSVKLRKSDIAYGYIHPCAAYPIDDIEISI